MEVRFFEPGDREVASSGVAFVSLLATFCVVGWHCGCSSNVERIAIPALMTWSVPWFFFVSGMFFRKTCEAKSTTGVLLAKFWSLLVPYVLWCLIGALTRGRVWQFGLDDWLGAFGLYPRVIHPTYDGALWYVRTLLVMMIVMSVARLMSCKLGKFALLMDFALFMGGMAAVLRFVMNLGPGSSSLYFGLGYLLSKVAFDKRPRLSDRTCAIVGGCCFAVAVVARLVWFLRGYDFVKMGGTFNANCATVSILAGFWFVFIWRRSGITILPVIRRFATVSAVVYFGHQCFLPYMVDFARRYMTLDVAYVLLVTVSPLLFYLFFLGAKRIGGRAYRLLSGGR